VADVQTQECAGFSGAVSISGQTAPFDLAGQGSGPGGGARVVQAVSAVSSVGTSIQVTLQILTSGSPDDTGNWTSLVALPSQSAAGVQVASGTVPAGVPAKLRLSWALVGAGAAFAAFAVGVG
jgi:hypothetical protein